MSINQLVKSASAKIFGERESVELIVKHLKENFTCGASEVKLDRARGDYFCWIDFYKPKEAG